MGWEPLKIVPLTSYPGYERYASFSPDGNQVAFSWKEENRGKFHVYTKTLGSGNPVRRTTHAADHLSPAWSPDGRFLAFHRILAGEKAEIVLMPASGGPEGASVINCWWPYHKDPDCNMLQPNSALSIPVRVQIGEKCFCQKKLRTTHQQWIAEAPPTSVCN